MHSTTCPHASSLTLSATSLFCLFFVGNCSLLKYSAISDRDSLHVYTGPMLSLLVYTKQSVFGVHCPFCSGHKPTELAHSFYSVLVSVFLYGPFNCISFYKLSRQLSVFPLCSSGLISALLVLSTLCLFIKVSLSPDIILCG